MIVDSTSPAGRVHDDLRMPRDATFEAIDAPLAALLFFTALPLLDTTDDQLYGSGGRMGMGGSL